MSGSIVFSQLLFLFAASVLLFLMPQIKFKFRKCKTQIRRRRTTGDCLFLCVTFGSDCAGLWHVALDSHPM